MEKRSTVEVEELIRDAEDLLRKAIDEIPVNLRNAAEKAWAATVRSSDALVLAKTGIKPTMPFERRRELEAICLKEPEAEKVKICDRYGSRETYLHGMCFYEGKCEPPEAVERRIRETRDLIEDIKRLIK